MIVSDVQGLKKKHGQKQRQADRATGLERLSELLRRGLMIAGGVSLPALTLLATMNVALGIFRVPVSGTYEVVSFPGAIVTAGALGYTRKRKEHIVVDILSEKFPAPVKRLLDRVSHTLILMISPYRTVLVLSDLVK